MEVKKCARCGSVFECKVDDIPNCQCATIRISEATSLFLTKTEFDCLCKNCLQNINIKIEQLKNEILPPLNQLKEGFHFYKEGNYVVFTDNFLILRGYCCKSACRNCPYGFKKTEYL
jgi:Family of unknown function (DUF5522)/Cysteine-rich CWC